MRSGCVRLKWYRELYKVNGVVLVEDHNVRTPGGVAVEWELVCAIREVDLDLACWVFAFYLWGQVLQDAVMPPGICARVEQAGAVVQGVVESFLHSAMWAGGIATDPPT